MMEATMESMKSNPMYIDREGFDIYGVHVNQHLGSNMRCKSEAEQVRSQVSGWDLTDVNGKGIKEIAMESAIAISSGIAISGDRGSEIFEFRDGSILLVNHHPYGSYVVT